MKIILTISITVLLLVAVVVTYLHHAGHDHGGHDHSQHETSQKKLLSDEQRKYEHAKTEESQHDHSQQEQVNKENSQQGHSHDHAHHAHRQYSSEPELVITPISPNKLTADDENKIALFIQDAEANPVDISEFQVVHTQPVHLLIINPELNDYHHEHLIQESSGYYSFNFTPTTSCSYRMWADVKLKGSFQHYIPVQLNGAEKCDRPSAQETALKASSQGYDFVLELDGNLKAGEAIFAHMSVFKNGQLVNFLEPVMGAFAHMVGFYEDYETIAHIHPTGKEPADDSERGGPKLSFHIEPKQAGYLKLFAQVQLDGKQVFAPFGLAIE